jgi:glucose/arabinose dehydrogenase/cytochrome c2
MAIRYALRRVALCMLSIAASAPALGADATAGKAVFKQQCALCHTAEPNDNGGAQGPSLAGTYGRRAASNSAFTYSKALRDANLTWDAPTLDKFLAAPTIVVPGTTMVIPVARQADRENVIAYLQSRGGQWSAVPGAMTSSTGAADWKKDAPGREHRIDAAKLPAPFATEAARNRPKQVDRPGDAKLSLPPGFKIDVFSDKLQAPRRMRVAPNGDVFVAETQGGRISILHPTANGVTGPDVFAAGLKQPFGMAFYPNEKNPQWLYVGESHRVVRFAYRTGDTKAKGEPEIVVPELPTGGHYTRDIAFSPDGKRLFVAVGSASNVAEDMPKKTPAEIRAWEAEYGVGAAWGKETHRAAVMVFELGSNKPGKNFANGLRNCVGLTVQPKTGDLWCTTNERDLLGDDLVPDYSTRVKEGGFYGWPWYYFGANEDPRLQGDRPDLRSKVIVPDVPFESHSAALTLDFYTATGGSSAFPADYVGDGFAVFHGSWNRALRTGHKVVRVRMKNGVPTGEYEDFLTGFIVDDGSAWGRPVATAFLQDGSMLLSDDGSNLIYRISYAR